MRWSYSTIILKNTILHEFTYQKLASQLNITNECFIMLIHVFDTIIWPNYQLELWYLHAIPWVICDEVYFKLLVNIHGKEIITLPKDDSAARPISMNSLGFIYLNSKFYQSSTFLG